jgi:glycerol-3-phosphate dehydrogenase
MVRLAPHLVRPLALVVPAFEGVRPDRLMGIGLNMYDVMATTGLRGRRASRRSAELFETPGFEDWSPQRHRVIDGEEVVKLLPALAARNPTAGYLFYDCQTDDVRLVLTVLGEAERFGAVCANGVEVTELVQDEGRATGVRVREADSGSEWVVGADNVINATGVWADRIRPDELHAAAEVPTIRPSRGTHVTLSPDVLPLVAGAIVPAAGGRSIFALPWLGRTLLGTTDNDYEGELDHVRPAPEDIDYLLEAASQFFGRELTTAQLTGAYAGVRPLISTADAKKSVDISRKAELFETAGGLITITGGKLTTWRRMAKLAVDRMVERDGREAPCRTHEVPLGLAVAPESLPAVEGVHDDSYRALAARYGHSAHEVLRLAAERGELAQPIVPGLPDLLAEAVHAARHEQARSVADVLLRRTRLGLLAARDLSGEEDDGVVARVAAAVGGVLGWDAAREGEEIERFRAEAAAEGMLVG